MARSSPAPAALLAELIAVPSVHPEAHSGGTVSGEAALAALLAERLRQWGAAVAMPRLAPDRPMVVGVFDPPGRPVATVILAPHLDTVGVAGMTVPAFRLTRRAGRLHGRGACDTKGPMAALLWAVDRWTRQPAASRGRMRWIIAATAGEEQGGLGAAVLVRNGLKADFAVALEPTALRVVSAAKGVLRVRLTATGRAAHGSRPDRGVNAIERLLPLAAAVPRFLAPRLARCVHPLLGAATVNLGVLTGGGELNVVPDSCQMGLDIRTHPGVSEHTALAMVDSLRRRMAPELSLAVIRQGASFVTDRGRPWARTLRACGRGWATADWFSDANIFSGAGIPSVAFGPGDIRQAHTRDEFITVDALDSGARAFLRLLNSG